MLSNYKFQGPMNTAQNIWTYNEKGKLEQGLVAQNQRLLSIHAGLIFARSLFWTRAVEKALSKSGKKPEIVFSFDEPGFEQLDSGFGASEKKQASIYIPNYGDRGQIYPINEWFTSVEVLFRKCWNMLTIPLVN